MSSTINKVLLNEIQSFFPKVWHSGYDVAKLMLKKAQEHLDLSLSACVAASSTDSQTVLLLLIAAEGSCFFPILPTNQPQREDQKSIGNLQVDSHLESSSQYKTAKFLRASFPQICKPLMFSQSAS